jgi:NAD(P)H-hydrate epimerase
LSAASLGTDALPRLPTSTLPALTATQMAEVDRLAVEEFGVDILQLMEQAGSHLAELVRTELGGDLRGKRVIVAVGPGNNGGGGLAAARHLANRGAAVRVVLARPVNRLGESGRHQLATLFAMSVDCCVAIYGRLAITAT